MLNLGCIVEYNELFYKARMNAIQVLELKLKSVGKVIDKTELNLLANKEGSAMSDADPAIWDDDRRYEIGVLERLIKRQEALYQIIGKLRFSSYDDEEISPESMALKLVILAVLKTAEEEQRNKKKIKEE